MVKIKNKYLRYSLFAAPVVVASMAIGIYFIVKNKTNVKKITQTNDSQNELHDGALDQYIKIFPEMSTYDFYEYIRVDDGKAIIDNRLIAKFVNEVIKKTKYTNGEIRWEVNRLSKAKVKLTFVWIPSATDQKKVWKNYELSLSEDE